MEILHYPEDLKIIFVFPRITGLDKPAFKWFFNGKILNGLLVDNNGETVRRIIEAMEPALCDFQSIGLRKIMVNKVYLQQECLVGGSSFHHKTVIIIAVPRHHGG